MQERFLTTYKKIINLPASRVWEGLTNAEIVKQYFFGTDLVTTWEVGTPILFKGDWEGQGYEDKGIILEYIPNKFASYTYLSSWSNLPDEPENYLNITYSVEETSEGTVLTITQTNYDQEKADHSQSSWDSIMEEMVKVLS